MLIQNMHAQRDVRVYFDLVDFLTYHMHDVDITIQDARDLSRAMRMTDTRDLRYFSDIAYLKALENLTGAQMNKLLQLVLEVRSDPAYTDEYEYGPVYNRVVSTRPHPSKFKSRWYPQMVVSLARRLL